MTPDIYIYVPLVVNRSFLHSSVIIGFVTRLTRWVPLVEHELPTLPEHLSSPPVFSGVRVTRSLVLQIVICPFALFLLAIVLSVLRYSDSDYPFGIFKHFSRQIASQFKLSMQIVIYQSRKKYQYVYIKKTTLLSINTQVMSTTISA